MSPRDRSEPAPEILDGSSGNGRACVKHSGWFSVGEEEIRRIANAYEEPASFRAAFIAYVTVRRKANLRGSLVFEDRIINMAGDMGMQYREAQKALRLIESIGLVSIERRKIPGTNANLPSIYTVPPLWHDATPSQRDAITSEHDDRTLGEDGVQGHVPAAFLTTPPTTPQEYIHTTNTTRPLPVESSETDGRHVDGNSEPNRTISFAALVEEQARRLVG